METQTNDIQTLAQQFIDALHTLEQGSEADVDALVALYSDDAHLTNAALRVAGDDRRGQDAIRHFWSEYKRTVGNAYSEFHQVTANEEAAGLFWTTRITGNDGEQGASYDGTSLLVFDGAGKIRFFQGYYDTRELNHAMGVGPESQTPAPG
jgi:ketosteroid isomerase-like protein